MKAKWDATPIFSLDCVAHMTIGTWIKIARPEQEFVSVPGTYAAQGVCVQTNLSMDAHLGT